MKINLGAGYKHYDGFLNIDDDPLTKPDYLVNLETDKLPLDDSSVDAMICHHILEHIGQGFIPLMQEIYRVCKHGAIIDIVVPHHFHEVFINDPTHKRPITVEGMRLLSKKYNQHQIETHNSSSGLGLKFNIDFEIVEFNYVHDPFYDEIVKRNTEEQNIRLFRECVNVTQETHMKLVVVKE